MVAAPREAKLRLPGFDLASATSSWVLFAGTLGLGRSFALEREADALTGVLVSPVPGGAVFLGKFLANLLIVLAVEAVVFPVYALFFGLRFAGALGGLVLVGATHDPELFRLIVGVGSDE